MATQEEDDLVVDLHPCPCATFWKPRNRSVGAKQSSGVDWSSVPLLETGESVQGSQSWFMAWEQLSFCVPDSKEEDDPINEHYCLTHQSTILQSKQNKDCFRKVNTCGTILHLCCETISVLWHPYWVILYFIYFLARCYAKQMGRSILFPQGNLSVVGKAVK